MAYTIQGKRVSKYWFIILREALKWLRFQLNSGNRTIAEQWVLWRNYKRVGWPIAAFPNPNAPHIRVGRQDHALDVDTNVGAGEAGLQRWLEKNGVRMSNPVRGEAWHMEANRGDLRKLAVRIEGNNRKLHDLRLREKRVRDAIIRDQRAGRGTDGQRRLLDEIRADLKKYEAWFR